MPRHPCTFIIFLHGKKKAHSTGTMPRQCSYRKNRKCGGTYDNRNSIKQVMIRPYRILREIFFFNDELHDCIFGSVVLNSSAQTLSSTPVTVNQARFCREEKESVYVKSFRVDSSLGFLSGRYDMQFVHSIWSLTAFREVKLLPWRRLQTPLCACPCQMDNYVWFWRWLSFANWHQRDRDEWWEIFFACKALIKYTATLPTRWTEDAESGALSTVAFPDSSALPV